MLEKKRKKNLPLGTHPLLFMENIFPISPPKKKITPVLTSNTRRTRKRGKGSQMRSRELHDWRREKLEF